jgi:hypothetical protein
MNNRIITLGRADVQWPFGEDPTFRCKLDQTYDHTVKIDPFPCYAHDAKLVEEVVEQVESRFPVGFPPKYFLLEHEAINRTNGYADRHIHYGNGKEPYDWEPLILLHGKRIPIHPAMTRYLVAHEYGHVAQWWIEHCRGIKAATTTDMDREYMEIRNGSDNEYGGGRWHTNVGELIANDFRICVTGVEMEFWPHPGFKHPMYLHDVQRYWSEMVEKFTFKKAA